MQEQEVLRSIGKWLKINGEAIYGSFRLQGMRGRSDKGGRRILYRSEGKGFTPQDFRFTVQGGHIYAIALRGSDDGQYFVHTFAEKTPSGGEGFTGIITKAEVLGEKTPAVWEQTKEGLKVTTDYRSGQPVVIRLTLA
jgi:alpha-L-fucosidase